jgi:protein-tyrosine phosphatase
VIDLHCHVLPGIDDGAATIEDSLAIARAAVAAGTRTMVATPHVSAHYPNEAATIGRLVVELNERLLAEGIPLDVRAGAEVAITSAAELAPERLAELTLGGGPWLLLEPPFTQVASPIDAIVLDILDRGHRVLLAHPERCPAFHRKRDVLEALVRDGVLTSITAGSLVGRFGREVRSFALQLVRDGLVHNVTSDAHDPLKRAPGAIAELADAGLGTLTVWFTEEVPAAILSGAEVPLPPSGAIERLQVSRRRWWRQG